MKHYLQSVFFIDFNVRKFHQIIHLKDKIRCNVKCYKQLWSPSHAFYHPDMHSHAKYLKLENINLISYPTWNWLYHMKAKQKGKKRKRKQTDNIANIQISKIYKKTKQNKTKKRTKQKNSNKHKPSNITKNTLLRYKKTVININPPT